MRPGAPYSGAQKEGNVLSKKNKMPSNTKNESGWKSPALGDTFKETELKSDLEEVSASPCSLQRYSQ